MSNEKQQAIGMTLITQLDDLIIKYAKLPFSARKVRSFKFDANEVLGEWIESRKELKALETEKLFEIETTTDDHRMLYLVSNDILDIILGRSDIVFE